MTLDLNPLNHIQSAMSLLLHHWDDPDISCDCVNCRAWLLLQEAKLLLKGAK